MPSRAKIKAACEALSTADAALGRAYESIGVPVWRAHPPVYATIARTIAYQQISTVAASAIWARVEAGLGDITPDRILKTEPEALQAFGLSRPKVAHLRSIAEAITTGALDLDRVCAANLEDARAELVAVKGIGPWTAELFLLYAVGEMDAFPTGDVGLMEAYRQLENKKKRMEIKPFTKRAVRWRPYRGVAAHLLWGYLNAERARVREAAPRA